MSEVCANLMCLRNSSCPACGRCDDHCICEMLAIEARISQQAYHDQYKDVPHMTTREKLFWWVLVVFIGAVALLAWSMTHGRVQ